MFWASLHLGGSHALDASKLSGVTNQAFRSRMGFWNADQGTEKYKVHDLFRVVSSVPVTMCLLMVRMTHYSRSDDDGLNEVRAQFVSAHH